MTIGESIEQRAWSIVLKLLTLCALRYAPCDSSEGLK
jgi:hypothetical protein